MLAFAEQFGLLRAPAGGRRQFLVEAGLEDDVGVGELLLGLPQLQVEPAERRAAIAGDEAGGVQPVPAVALALHQQHADDGLRAGQEDALLAEVELVVERDVVKRHQAFPLREAAPNSRGQRRGRDGASVSSACRTGQTKSSVPGKAQRTVRQRADPAHENDAAAAVMAHEICPAAAADSRVTQPARRRYTLPGNPASAGPAGLPSGWPARSLLSVIDRPDDQRPVRQDRLVERRRHRRVDASAAPTVGALDADRHGVGLVLDHAGQRRALERHHGELRPDFLADHQRLAAGRVLEAGDRDLALVHRLQRLERDDIGGRAPGGS